MVQVESLSEHFAPNTIRQLQQAAKMRYADGETLWQEERWLGAMYLYGYSVEMYLAAAYFRSAGFGTNQIIEKWEIERRMKQARKLQHRDGKPLMTSDPHPLVGWARFVEWNRSSSGNLPMRERNWLQESVRKAELVYKHWRPELRYKTINVSLDQINEVRICVHWFIKRYECL